MDFVRFGGPAGESGAGSSANPKLAERLVLMCTSALFTGLTERDCREIAACASARTFARDELLCFEGQPDRNLILLQSGRVKHTQLSSDGDEVLMWMSGSGDAINPQAELPSCKHTCSVRAMEQCNALVWEYGRLQVLLARYPQIRENIGKILDGRLRELEERFREVSTERVATRLALMLLRLVKQIGKQTDAGVQISLSREELAQMTGTTLFTISRVLSRWADKGFITVRRESVVIADPERLKRFINEDEQAHSRRRAKIART